MSTVSLPAHKLIPQTAFIVDGFKYKSPQIKQYFLSHAHSGMRIRKVTTPAEQRESDSYLSQK